MWYRQAAEQGHTKAQTKLSLFLVALPRQSHGSAVPQNREIAFSSPCLEMLTRTAATCLRMMQRRCGGHRLVAAHGEWMAQQALQEMYVEG